MFLTVTSPSIETFTVVLEESQVRVFGRAPGPGGLFLGSSLSISRRSFALAESGGWVVLTSGQSVGKICLSGVDGTTRVVLDIEDRHRFRPREGDFVQILDGIRPLATVTMTHVPRGLPAASGVGRADVTQTAWTLDRLDVEHSDDNAWMLVAVLAMFTEGGGPRFSSLQSYCNAWIGGRDVGGKWLTLRLTKVFDNMALVYTGGDKIPLVADRMYLSPPLDTSTLDTVGGVLHDRLQLWRARNPEAKSVPDPRRRGGAR